MKLPVWLDVFLVTRLRVIDHRLRPNRYWTQKELNDTRRHVEEMRKRLNWR